MFIGIFWAVFAGVILGFYALPEKFTKDFKFENTWGMFFFTAMLIFPFLVSLIFIKGAGEVYSSIPGDVFLKMFISSFLWGVGMMMWGKALNHIGVSLGFSLFIGTIILVGPLLPFFEDGLPPKNSLIAILAGIVIVLLGVIANGKAGLLRSADEEGASGEEKSGGSMAMGILIAVVGGLLATGFSYANAAGRPTLQAAALAQGNAEWVSGIAVMSVIYFVGGLVCATYFIWQLSKKKLWGAFKTPHFGKNISMTTLMAIFNFGASISFAYSAFKLGAAGNTVGYAIFNTISVAVAAIGGLLTGEWKDASPRAKRFLYIGILGMIAGVVVIAVGNSMAM